MYPILKCLVIVMELHHFYFMELNKFYNDSDWYNSTSVGWNTISTSYGTVNRSRAGWVGFYYYESGGVSVPNGITTLIAANSTNIYKTKKSISVMCTHNGANTKVSLLYDNINGLRVNNSTGAATSWITGYLVICISEK